MYSDQRTGQPRVATTTALAPGDDYAGDITTTGVILPCGTVTGEIEERYDDDWFAITLAAGDRVAVTLEGISLGDPSLYLFDSSGDWLGPFGRVWTYAFMQINIVTLADTTVFLEATGQNGAVGT